ncbi:MAG TPA: glucuronate isomerase [Hanamia sp.]
MAKRFLDENFLLNTHAAKQLNHGFAKDIPIIDYHSHLFLNQIEKSIYKNLLGAENPETGCISYYTLLMGKNPFSCGISCCTSSVSRGIAMIPYFTFGNLKNVPTLMLYEPASYKKNITTASKKIIHLSLQIESNFPENGDAVVTLNTSQTTSFPLALRVPSWCSSFTATFGTKEYKGIANQNLIINRIWKSGEKIKVSFKMPIQTIAGDKSYPNQIAFQRGPQVLALDDSLNTNSFFDQKQNFTFSVSFGDYFKGKFKDHLVGILGGAIWSIGMSLSIIASGKAGPAISYGLGQGATVVAALWGIYVWKEFDKAPKGTKPLLNIMLLLYIAGLAMIILSK